VIGLFGIAIFLAAALLFLIQPMVAKMLLPLLGGSPSVWNACMVFFQAALLAGYAYSHLVGTRLKPRTQVVVHTVVLLAAGATLPIALAASADPGDKNPTIWLIGILALTAGAPFFVVSTSGPLVQKWFAASGHKRSGDPYFLYAASNAGSLIGLLSYPFIVEPLLPLRSQSLVWTAAYAVLAILLITCGVMGMKGAARVRATAASPSARDEREGSYAKKADKKRPSPPKDSPGQRTTADAGAAVPPPVRPRWLQRARWVLCAAVPSSLMLGVTQYLSTDVAAVPLLWVVPLSLYLLSFILAFAQSVKLDTRKLGVLVALLCMAAAVLFAVGNADGGLVLPAALHLLLLFLSALLCHRVLADERPEADRLTEFYLLLSVGGVLGGAFNSLLAPLVFTSLLEYPIAIAAVCLVRPASPGDKATPAWKRTAVALGWGVAMGLAIIGSRVVTFLIGNQFKTDVRGIASVVAAGVLILILAAAIRFARRPGPFAAAMLAGLLVVRQAPDNQISIYAARTFFGIHRAYTDPQGYYHTLAHGTTRHGVQCMVPELRDVPTTYFHYRGPLGQIFNGYEGRPTVKHVAIIGLGIGTIAAYAEPGDTYSYFEIDTAVVHAAEDPRLFTYLTDARARGAKINIVLGDGRLRVAQEPDASFGLFILDAFTSDAVPTHLLTKEAVELYRRKLQPRGVIALHLSNNHLDLVPVVAKIAEVLGVRSYLCDDQDNKQFSEQEIKREVRSPSIWMAITDDPEFAARAGPQWTLALPLPGAPLWTDQYSNIIGVFKN
jgi:hypothetical protein